MNDRIKQLTTEALKLELVDRVELADLILESVQAPPSEVQRACADEVRERVMAYGRGELELSDEDDVLALARSELKR
jgi:hypothetical protein